MNTVRSSARLGLGLIFAFAAAVTASAQTAPIFSSQPAALAVSAGQFAQFSANANGDPTPTLQWQYQPAAGGGFSDLADGGAYSGVTTTTLTVTGTTMLMNGDQFRVVASNGINSTAVSGAATLTVNPVPVTFALDFTNFVYQAGVSQGPIVIAIPVQATFNTGGTLHATNVGTYTATAVATGNYTGTNNTLTWTIGKSPQGQPFITSLSSYGWGAIYTAHATFGLGGATIWSLGTGSTAPGAAINATTGVVTTSGIGTVVIRAQYAGDANYNPSPFSAESTVTVQPGPVTFHLTGNTLIYTGSAIGPTIVPAPANATFTPGGAMTATNVGNYTATATAIGNYTGSNASLAWTIVKDTPGSPAITSSHNTILGQPYTATAEAGFGALFWSLDPVITHAPGAAIDAFTGVVTATGVGPVVIMAQYQGDANHNATARSAGFVVHVNPIPTAFALNATDFTYTGAAQGPTINATPADATFTTSGILSATNAGSYTATATATGNYSGTENSLTWSIAKANQAALNVISSASSTFGATYTATAIGGSGTGGPSWALGAGSTAPGAAVNAATGEITTTGAGTVVIYVTKAADTNYLVASSADFTVTLAKAAATVILSNLSATYDGAAHAASAVTTPGSLAVTFTYNGSATAPTSVGTYVVVGTINDANYQGSASGSLVISKATPIITWSAPADIIYGTALGATQLNATANVPGSFVYNPTSGTVLGAGVQSLNTTFNPTDTADYNTASGSTAIMVNAVPVITTQPIGHYVTVGANVTLTATATGTPAPTYQWKKGGADIPGATTASYAITNAQLADGDVYTVVATNLVGTATSNATTLTVTVASLTPKLGDFTNDGNPDILWRNSATGAFALWLMNGTVRQSAFTIGSAPLDWEVAGTGDFNGDGQLDLVWRNPTTGTVAFWLMNGTATQSIVVTANVPTDWTIYGTGDFNGDGKTDLLWRNPTTGTVAYWLMNGTAQQTVVLTTNVPTEWTISGTGDFNGDGKVDILWRKPSTGDVAFWLMNGTALQTVVVTANVPTDWTIAGTGDYNGDGQVDILWQNYNTGGVAFWLMNGTAMQSAVVIGNIPAGWYINN